MPRKDVPESSTGHLRKAFDESALKRQRRYIKLKQSKTAIEVELKELEKEIIKDMSALGVRRVNRPSSSLFYSDRVYPVYSSETKQAIKEIQDDDDSVEFKTSSFLRITYPESTI